MSRLLLGLVAFQTILVGALAVKVLSVDSRLERLAAAAAAQPAGAAPLAPSAAPPAPAYAPPGLAAEDVRRIIREEIAASRGGPDRQPAPAEEKAAGAYAGQSPHQLKNRVEQDIAHYVGRGRIAESEMVELQLKIAALPPAERREMLSKLTKALNGGQLKGQL